MDRAVTAGHATIGIMATLLLVLVVVLVIGGLVYGVVSLLSGDDPGLVPAEPDGRARPLPNDRSLHEDDLKEIRFDVALRGYRMAQVDRMLRRVAYDLGYKDEMIAVLEAEVAALREGRLEDAELLRKAREAASAPDRDTTSPAGTGTDTVGPDTVGSETASSETASSETASSESEPVVRGETGLAESGESPDGRPSEDGPEGTVAAEVDSTEPELPREGSLLRRPLADQDVSADAANQDGSGDAEAAERAAVDGADRPAHA